MATSSITSNDIVHRVRARWKDEIPRQAIARADHNIGLCIYGGLERLGLVIKDSEGRQFLMKEITKTPTSGVIDLTHADFNGIFIDTLKRPDAVRLADGSMPAMHCPTYNGLLAKTPTDTLWYHLLGKKLVFKNPSTGALNTYATPLIYTASYVPSLITADARPLPEELEDQLVDRVAEIVGKLGGLNFLRADEDSAVRAVGGA